MPIDPVPPLPPDLVPLSKLPHFDPRTVPVAGIDSHLPPVARAAMAPDALRDRFRVPPAWEPEIWAEKRFTDRQPAEAAVLVPIVMRDEPTVLLTERATHLSTHSGQVAFPGGKRDDTDRDASHTALREAHEEIGLHDRHVEVLGQMPTYTTGTRFEVPLKFLMNPAHHRRHVFDAMGTRREWFSMPYMDGDTERFIWGATAAMLRNFYRFLAA